MAKASTQRGTILGTGMGLIPYLMLLAVSVLLFVGWGGWMWHGRAGDSHVGRFVVSYFSILPLAAATLWFTRAFSWARFATAVGTLWGFKLVITALLYFAVGPRGGMFGMSTKIAKAQPSGLSTPAAVQSVPYEAAAANFTHGSLTGSVSSAGVKRAGVAVYLHKPAPGRELDEASIAPIVVTATGFKQPLFVGFEGSPLKAENGGNALVRLALVNLATGKSVRNLPLPAGGRASFTPGSSGEFDLKVSAGDAAAKQSHLLVLDHPYVVLTDANGQFSMPAVPVGEARVNAFGVIDGVVLKAQSTISFVEGKGAQLDLKLAPAT